MYVSQNKMKREKYSTKNTDFSFLENKFNL